MDLSGADQRPVTGPVEQWSLTRGVRFCIPFSENDLDSDYPPRHNTYAAWPSMVGLGAYYELRVVCAGRADTRTGYVMSISSMDEAVRSRAVPTIETAIRREPDLDPAPLLRRVGGALGGVLGSSLRSVIWQLTPFYALEIHAAVPDRVLIHQNFSFAAAHRLHCDELGEEENRAIFGKCANTHGHGHNYRLEVSASVGLPEGDGRPAFTVADLERVVDKRVVSRFDHTHLNRDTTEFAHLNPSVEHIAKVCHDLLVEPIAEAGGRLERVTVWETEKTACSYPA